MSTLNFEAISHKSIFEAFDFSIDPIAVTDANLDNGVAIIYVNSAFCNETGYTKEELIGQNPNILQGEKSNRALLGTLKEKLKQDGNFKGQTVNYKKDGSEYIVQWTISSLKDRYGKVIAYVSFHKIITQQVNALNENDLLQKVIHNVPSSIIITDLEANIIYVNNAFLKNIQYRSDELIGKNARVLKSGKQSDKYYKNMWEKLSSEGSFEGVFISSRKDGTLFYDKKTIQLIKDENGKPQYYVGVSHDITQLTLALQKQKRSVVESQSNTFE